MLEVVFEDDYLIAIHKPNGLLVHRTKLAAYEKKFAMQELRNQIGQHVFPVHRLDRATSGLLLFAKNKEVAANMSHAFAEHRMEKTYLAWVRGFVPENGTLDSPILDENRSEAQEALTHYERLATVELPYDVSRYPTSRYSIVAAKPKTGRRHQIRKHFAKIRHYIVGDKRHGDCKHNNYFRDHLESETLLLHAWKLQFEHPVTQKKVKIEAPLRDDFARLAGSTPWVFEENSALSNSLKKELDSAVYQ